jgi:hypothetical protein
MDNKALLELAKSFGRFIYFGLLGLVATFLVSLGSDQSLANAHVTIAGTSFNVGFVILAVVAGVAKAIDRYVHANDNIDAKGIAPF